jgi:Cid1 family poly A polymerase
MYLYGFFYFYTHVFPVTMFVISIRRGGGSSCSSPSTPTTDRNGGDNNNNLLLLPKTAFCRGTSIACCMNSFSIEDPFERYDSHRPHDLFSPADERGFQRIAQCFHQAEAEWRTLLVQLAAVTAETNCKDDIGSDETSSSDNEDVADKVKTKLMMGMASNWHRRAAVVADSANKTQKGKQQQNGINDKVQPKNTQKKQKQLPRKGGNQHHNGNRGKPHVAPQNAPPTRGQPPQHLRDDGGRTGVGNDRINKKTVSTSNHVPAANGRNHEKGQSSRTPGNKVRSSNDAVGTNDDPRKKGEPSSADKGTASGGRGDVAAPATTSKVDAAPTTANAARDDANAMHQSANGNSNSGQKRNRGNRSRGGGRGGRGGRGRSQQQQQ